MKNKGVHTDAQKGDNYQIGGDLVNSCSHQCVLLEVLMKEVERFNELDTRYYKMMEANNKKIQRLQTTVRLLREELILTRGYL